MDNSLNIVDLIENNPITRLSNTYQNKLLIKIKENFNDSEQQMFVASFYCFLNYNQRNDFVIDLDDVWKWLGFNQKYNAKHMLEQNFMIDIDYKIIAPEHSGAKNHNKILLNQKSEQTKQTRGGHNKETIKLTIRTFKLFCLKAGTKKAEQIHEYYIKLERLFIKSLDDECVLFTKNTQIEGEFIKSLDELIPLLASQKSGLTRHLIKNYKENYHYIIDNTKYISPVNNIRGGHNHVNYMLTEYAFELLKNSYNLRNKYITNVSKNVKCVNIGMCLENQTIGFIENSFNGVFDMKRQYICGKYKVDLYFPEYKLVIECDENNHDDRNQIEEKNRENYILSLGNSMIRFNPNDNNFELSTVLREINTILYSKEPLTTNTLILLP